MKKSRFEQLMRGAAEAAAYARGEADLAAYRISTRPNACLLVIDRAPSSENDKPATCRGSGT